MCVASGTGILNSIVTHARCQTQSPSNSTESSGVLRCDAYFITHYRQRRRLSVSSSPSSPRSGEGRGALPLGYPYFHHMHSRTHHEVCSSTSFTLGLGFPRCFIVRADHPGPPRLLPCLPPLDIQSLGPCATRTIRMSTIERARIAAGVDLFISSLLVYGCRQAMTMTMLMFLFLLLGRF